jgi:hypothetical protein
MAWAAGNPGRDRHLRGDARHGAGRLHRVASRAQERGPPPVGEELFQREASESSSRPSAHLLDCDSADEMEPGPEPVRCGSAGHRVGPPRRRLGPHDEPESESRGKWRATKNTWRRAAAASKSDFSQYQPQPGSELPPPTYQKRKKVADSVGHEKVQPQKAAAKPIDKPKRGVAPPDGIKVWEGGRTSGNLKPGGGCRAAA